MAGSTDRSCTSGATLPVIPIEQQAMVRDTARAIAS
jgi:hypothetical protein